MPTTIYQPSEAGLQTPFDIGRSILSLTASACDFHLKLPFGFATADAAVLFTVPTGLKLEVQRAYWEIATSFTGGSSSTLGVSSSNTNYSTKGDLLGGAAGDAAAIMVSTGVPYKGGVGTKLQATVTGGVVVTIPLVVLVGGDTVRLDRITSIYTAGAGFLHVSGMLID